MTEHNSMLTYVGGAPDENATLKEIRDVIRATEAVGLPVRDVSDEGLAWGLHVDLVLRQAVQNGFVRLVALMLRHKADVHQKDSGTGAHLLHYAAELPDGTDMMVLLTCAGAAVNVFDKKGKTPLSYAIECGCLANVRTLLALGAGITVRGHVFYDSGLISPLPIFYAMAASAPIPMLELLIEHGASIHGYVTGGGTLLHAASEHETGADAATFLIAHGVDINALNILDQTPLAHAYDRHALELARVLLDAGADIDKCGEYGLPPIQCTMQHAGGWHHAIELLARGAALYDYARRDVRDLEMFEVLAVFGIDEQMFAGGTTCSTLARWKHMAIKTYEGPQPTDRAFWQRVGERKKEIAARRWLFIRERAMQMCAALHNLRFPALVMVLIIQDAFLYADMIPFHLVWQMVTTVKHYHERQQLKDQK